MPTYDYRCDTCENTFEIFQSFSEDPLTSCPSEQCSGSVKKIFSAPGISFKGSGFYKNDSRSKSSSSTSGSAKKSENTESSATKDPAPEKPKKAESASSSTTTTND